MIAEEFHIGDCPEIKRALATGYPHPPREWHTAVVCDDCGAELSDDAPVYEWDGDFLCERCVRERIKEDFSIQEIAEALGIMCRQAVDCAAREDI